MIFSWFDAREAKEFGVSLAHFLIARIPLGGGTSIAKKQEVLKKMFNQMMRFRLEHKLNIYKKAQLGNAFKWTLKEAGYDSEFVDQLTKELMLH